MNMLCNETGRCDFHRDGGPRRDKCPGTCDADGCTTAATVDLGDDGCFCPTHRWAGALDAFARRGQNAQAAIDAAVLAAVVEKGSSKSEGEPRTRRGVTRRAKREG